MHTLIVPLAAAEATDAGRFGPKAANLARLRQAGLPVPDGFCVDAQAYRIQVAALGLEASARGVSSLDAATARRSALAMRLGLLDHPLAAELGAPLCEAWRALAAASRAPGVVRSSALSEDRFGSSFAGQFESYLGLETQEEFVTAVRSCWAALWSARVLRYMAMRDAPFAQTAMAILVQPLVPARVSGGGLSRDADGDMVLNATWGLGSAIAQGEVVPDRIVLGRDGTLRVRVAGRSGHRIGCAHRMAAAARPRARVPCLTAAQAAELGRLLLRVEDVMGLPVEIEWAQDDGGFQLLQARPLHLAAQPAVDRSWLSRPALKGHPAGVGWGTGPARVVNCECELPRVGAGDVLVTRVAGPALSAVLPRLSGLVAELGGSTSHLASLARERGIPMVLGVLDATRRIPDGAPVAVDGVAGVVRWIG